MICIILVAGHMKILEKQIKEDTSGKYTHLINVPKALLPGLKGKKVLDFWWDAIKSKRIFSAVYLVTNADKYKHFERWATASDFPVDNIINDGTSIQSNKLGSVADLELVLRTKNIQDDIFVIAGDMICQDQKFDLGQVVDYFRLKGEGNLAIYYDMDPQEATTSRGVVEVDDNHRILKFLEKPTPDETKSRHASVVFYGFRKEYLPYFRDYLSLYSSTERKKFGHLLDWMINIKTVPFFGMKLPTGFYLIGQVDLDNYEKCISKLCKEASLLKPKGPITNSAFARVGVMGNPSDGFYGKTISLTISNFWAEVIIWESDRLCLIPHPLNDPTEFGSMSDLHGISTKEGYLGGLRLLQATCSKFYRYCSLKGIALGSRNFTLRYDTNIPRQVGLAGSSAIVTATLRCLMEFFGLTTDDLPRELQPQFILDVEVDELCIKAGLQDRVVQVYEGLVYMDFNEQLMKTRGYGEYVRLSVQDLPRFWIAYASNPSDSGKIHSDVYQRWQNGDSEVISGMQELASLTEEAKNAMEKSDWMQVGELMSKNFDLRRKMYGDAALGALNLRMIDIARSLSVPAKFPGSGGAILGMCESDQKMEELQRTFQTEGFVFVKLIPKFPSNC